MSARGGLTARERRIIEAALDAFCAEHAMNEVDNGFAPDVGASPETITPDLRRFWRLLGRRLGPAASQHGRRRYAEMVNDIARKLVGRPTKTTKGPGGRRGDWWNE